MTLAPGFSSTDGRQADADAIKATVSLKAEGVVRKLVHLALQPM